MSNSISDNKTNPLVLLEGAAIWAVGLSTASVAKELLHSLIDEPETRSKKIRNSMAIYGLSAAASLAASHAVRVQFHEAVTFANDIMVSLKKEDDQDDVTPA